MTIYRKTISQDYVAPPANAGDDVQEAYPEDGGAWSTGWC